MTIDLSRSFGALLILVVACQTQDVRMPAAASKASSSSGSAGKAITLAPKLLQVHPQFRQGVFAQDREISLPPGFEISLFATGLGAPRLMTFGTEGDLWVTITQEGRVLVLPDRDGDGAADQVVTFAQGLNRPHGIVFRNGDLYVAETGRILRFNRRNGVITPEDRDVIVPNLPAGGGHFTRTLGFGTDDMMYVSIGSSCNACEERDQRRAAIVQYNPDGSGERVFARGLRNSVGFVFHPDTGEIWATDNGRDWLGDDLPPEEVNIVRDGGHYGWPNCYGNRIPDPEFGRPGFCQGTVPPVVEMQAHSAPLGLTFYTGQQFPREYWGDLFIAFHGSWNRTVPTGYKVIRVPLRNGEPGEPQDFATGWMVGGSAWGRPVAPLVAPDGSLYLSDDRAGAIYSIRRQK